VVLPSPQDLNADHLRRIRRRKPPPGESGGESPLPENPEAKPLPKNPEAKPRFYVLIRILRQKYPVRVKKIFRGYLIGFLSIL
jgi:hypothetical protein